MKFTITVSLAFLLILSVSTPLLSKAKTSKITISGRDLKTPIEISDPEILANCNVWTRTVEHGLIIDWSHGPVRQSPNTLHKYQVSFYAGAPSNERIVYVVYYAFAPGAQQGYVFLPGESDEWAGLNVRSIWRGIEGKWFHAWSAWERVARPLIERAELADSIRPR